MVFSFGIMHLSLFQVRVEDIRTRVLPDIDMVDVKLQAVIHNKNKSLKRISVILGLDVMH